MEGRRDPLDSLNTRKWHNRHSPQTQHIPMANCAFTKSRDEYEKLIFQNNSNSRIQSETCLIRRNNLKAGSMGLNMYVSNIEKQMVRTDPYITQEEPVSAFSLYLVILHISKTKSNIYSKYISHQETFCMYTSNSQSSMEEQKVPTESSRFNPWYFQLKQY